MAHFSEAWLAEYEARKKKAAPKPAFKPTQPLAALAMPESFAPGPVRASYGEITFRLIAPLMLPNRKKNLHWSVESKLKWALSNEAALAIGTLPAEPMQRAEVTVWRHGIQEPDEDNLVASLKWLLDILQPRSKRHPYGLGVIANDDRAHLSSVIHHIQCKHRPEQHTLVRVRQPADPVARPPALPLSLLPAPCVELELA